MTTITSYDLLGVQGRKVLVGIDISPGPAAMVFHGASLAEPSIREVRVRAKSAIVNRGYLFPSGTINVLLDIPGGYPARSIPDLAVAIGILVATEQMPWPTGVAVIGHLGLDGVVLPTDGVISKAIEAKADGISTLYVPRQNSVEASLVEGLDVVPLGFVSELVHYLDGVIAKPVIDAQVPESVASTTTELDLSDIRGQEHAKRALEIAAAGGHSILLVGNSGSGRTMLARRFTTVLPPMTPAEALEVAQIHSGAGLFSSHCGLPTFRPFRAPHHTVSDVAMTGGGTIPRPGETTLAHHGVLFLDELPEFQRTVLSSIEHIFHEGVSVVHSTKFGDVVFPARFLLVGSMSSCPCGHLGDLGDPRRVCTCTTTRIERYRARVAKFIDSAFDLVVELPAVAVETLRGKNTGEASAVVRERVVGARKHQAGRSLNALLSVQQLADVVPLGASEAAFLEKVVDRLGLSPEQYHRIVRVARTVAYLDGSVNVRVEHLAEAVQCGGKRVG